VVAKYLLHLPGYFASFVRQTQRWIDDRVIDATSSTCRSGSFLVPGNVERGHR
jgi:hypothetical protein